MRSSCELAAQTLVYIREYVRAKVSTEELDRLCHDFITSKDAYPSPLNYKGFPKSICTSKNEVVCHGIPSKKDLLKDGDILNIDVTTYFNGFHGDTNQTFLIGPVAPEVEDLVEVTYACMREAINQVRPGARLGDIGAIIEEIAGDHGFSVVEDFCGHGIGREFHESPQVLHVGTRGKGLLLREGMTFTIEPMINVGVKDTRILKDGWTAITLDKKLSAQFEHTLLVTPEGVEIMTLRPDEPRDYHFRALGQNSYRPF